MAGLGTKSSGTWSSKLGMAKEHQPPMWKTGWWGAEPGGGGPRLSRVTDQDTASSVPLQRRTHVSVSAVRTFGANWLTHTTRGSAYNQWLSFCFVQTETQIHGFMEYFCSVYRVPGLELNVAGSQLWLSQVDLTVRRGPDTWAGRWDPYVMRCRDNGTPRTIVEKA